MGSARQLQTMQTRQSSRYWLQTFVPSLPIGIARASAAWTGWVLKSVAHTHIGSNFRNRQGASRSLNRVRAACRRRHFPAIAEPKRIARTDDEIARADERKGDP